MIYYYNLVDHDSLLLHVKFQEHITSGSEIDNV